MIIKELTHIACYLNLATQKIRSQRGSLKWLTGNELKTIDVAAGRSEETQCLSWGETLWIANNDDADSDVQMQFLSYLGIDNGPDLSTHIKHIDEYGRRVLSMFANKIKPNGSSAKELLFEALTPGSEELGPAFKPGAAKTIRQIKLTSALTTHLISGISFVTGDYEGEGTNLHAEQKLLAAFGLRHKMDEPAGKVLVGGIKPPCATCEKVLKKAQERLAEDKYKNPLVFEDAAVERIRTEAGFAQVHASNIRSLDVDKYFPK
jgi:hypothetical protein